MTEKSLFRFHEIHHRKGVTHAEAIQEDFDLRFRPGCFLIRLKQGLTPPANEPGFIPGGAMNEPVAVVFSALLLSGLVWALPELLFRLVETIKKNRL